MRSLHPWPIFPLNLDPPAARSLCLQFAMQEWMECLKVAETIQAEAPFILCDEDLFQEMIAISKELEKFLLFSLENPFVRNGGSLDKLCFYCERLFNASKIDKQDSIHCILEQMRGSVLRTRAKIFSWKRKIPETASILEEIDLLCNELKESLSDLFSALFPYFEESRTDENVLFYLIEHREILNRGITPDALELFLGRLYPSGPTHLRAILCEGYTRRGFGDFYAKHEALIDSIEWMAAEEWASTTMS